ncbi:MULTISPECIES: exonuclease SbcCD subunit D [Coprococcus]|uniref:Nuclease SbcCD subunit D n=1 Tax=Coprococcus eutactus TaxID=33043 RepID=A0AAI9K667_9FIRM|nr:MULTISPECIES: exonuclease SbcCD subunit D [Coprococcus]MCU6723498.1 exonuclease SbcCD subunit D [Coprococcus aceti]GFO95367.1 nuclease SbcCD subunit D [Coprococcus eutactus]CDB79396.1 exonuclease SbcD [Coprococcus sp. CAG:131]CUO59446.1 Nuclease sbcCD subunit D [Coprococcus eutactus]
MRFIHLSDLHIGKRVNEFSMLEDQEYILKEILGIIDDEQPDGVIIAGDVYDKSVPSEEAVKLLDSFLTSLAKRKLQVYIISGNHDSAAKLAFASSLIDLSGIHISPVYDSAQIATMGDGLVRPYKLEDGKGQVANIYMLPFVKPAMVRAVFPDEADDIKDYTDACHVAVEHMDVDEKVTNILVAHQFVTGAVRSESEENVGGLDNVDVSVFDSFDYVALGHIHGPQKVGRETVRYCGTPLKYSLSEANHTKSVTVVDIPENKKIEIRTVPLVPMHELREVKGTFDELMDRRNYEGTAVDDYLYVVLTDEDDVPDALGKLRTVYPNVMKLGYDNTRTRVTQTIDDGAVLEGKKPIDLFGELYEKQNNKEMSDEQRSFVQDIIDSIWKEERL